MKALILDSGTLINLTSNGLLSVLEELQKLKKCIFLITDRVRYETIERPSHIFRFELGALKVHQLLDAGIINLPNKIGIESEDLDARTGKLMDIANHYLRVEQHWITLVSEAEISCLALSDELVKKGIENLIVMDERTTRMLAENPGSLGRLMSDRLKQRVEVVERNMSAFAGYKFIRSSELVYVAFKKGLINLGGKNALEALLYATKFHGASISFEEIERLKQL